ncbi:hypothetical protein M2282_001250 [Variovorax boronicumulans]|nr:hypothetical protein [Variovorax boronicumulans]MDH6166109.1 hypothetical protein [Variovorax boronicumulans]
MDAPRNGINVPPRKCTNLLNRAIWSDAAGRLSLRDRPYPSLKFLCFLSWEVRYRYGAKLVEVRAGRLAAVDATALHGIEAIQNGPVSCLSVVFTLRE